jgi:ribosomal protein S9
MEILARAVGRRKEAVAQVLILEVLDNLLLTITRPRLFT